MKKLTLFIALALACATASAQQNEWMVFVDEDKMTGEKSAAAFSPHAISEDGKRAFLSVRFDHKKSCKKIIMLASLKSSSFWDVSKHRKKNASFRLRWAGDVAAGVEEVKGEEFSFLVYKVGQRVGFSSQNEVFKRLKIHPSVLVEIPFYREGDFYFDISLAGAASAIDEVHKFCKDAYNAK